MVNFFRKPLFDTPAWGLLIPLIAIGVLFAVMGSELSGFQLLLVFVALFSAVLMAVHHAEVIALRVGEPFGTLVLALAVTIIEVSLIVTLMLSGGEAISALARDTVFATVMIVCNGVIGLCLLLGAWRHRVLVFRVDGTTPTLSVLAVLSTLVLVLPKFTSSTSGATLTNTQLVFAGVVSLLLYVVFVFVLTIRHREYFLPPSVPGSPNSVEESQEGTVHARPSILATVVSLVFLLVSLVAVVGLAKTLAPAIEAGVNAISAPMAVVGIAIAMLVLLPETLSAVRAAMRNRMQISFNLALGSALATIGLTIPAVAVTSLMLDLPLELGLPYKEMSLLALTLLISTMTISRNSATVLQGAVHLVLFVVFLFLSIFP